MIEKYYEINAPEVISEPMEEEMVVINLDNGCYYSLNKTAASLWNDLEQGLSIRQAAGRMAVQYGSEEAQVLADLAGFIERLLEERLIRPALGHVQDCPPLAKRQGEAYIKPGLEKYADMQEMLLLDPIHEVSDAGWPHQEKK